MADMFKVGALLNDDHKLLACSLMAQTGKAAGFRVGSVLIMSQIADMFKVALLLRHHHKLFACSHSVHSCCSLGHLTVCTGIAMQQGSLLSRLV